MPIRLDERLTAVVQRIPYGSVADVGCDHGKLGYYLVSTDRASNVIATDISLPSLNKAKELAKENGVSHLIETRAGDGLAPVASGEVDTVVIAGLGGDVIADILMRAREQGKEFAHFVLSPNTHPEKVRDELSRSCHVITSDGLTECANKYYTIISSDNTRALATHVCEELDPYQRAYGKFYERDEVFKKRGEEELACMKNILSVHYSDELERKIAFLSEALERVKIGE